MSTNQATNYNMDDFYNEYCDDEMCKVGGHQPQYCCKCGIKFCNYDDCWTDVAENFYQYHPTCRTSTGKCAGCSISFN